MRQSSPSVTKTPPALAMKSTKSNKRSTSKPRAKAMTISSLIDTPSELTDTSSSKTAIVLMTRVRLARNLAGHAFPGWAKPGQREDIFQACRAAVAATPQMKRSFNVAIGDLSELERQILVERHLISRELSGAKTGA